MPQDSPRKRRERRLKRRVNIAESNFQLRQENARLNQYLKFVSTQAYEARALLFTILDIQGISIPKAELERIQKELPHLELQAKTDPDNEAVLILQIVDTNATASTPAVTITKVEDETVGSGAEDVGADVLTEGAINEG